MVTINEHSYSLRRQPLTLRHKISLCTINTRRIGTFIKITIQGLKISTIKQTQRLE